MPPTPPICSPCRSTATSTPGSPTPRSPPSRSAWPASKAGSARWPRPAGRRAELLVFTALAGAGDHIVASAALYGGTHTLLDVSLRRLGIETTFVAADDPPAFDAAMRPETKARLHRDHRQPLRGGRRPGGTGRGGPPPRRPAGRRRRPWPRRTCAAPSSTGPTWWCTRPPSSSAGTALRIGGVVVESGRVRLGQRAVPADDRAGRQLRRPAVLGQLRRVRLLHQAPRRAAARLRHLPRPLQRLPAAAGPRDPGPAHGRPRGQRPGPGRAPRRPPGGGMGLLRRAARLARTTTWPGATCPRGRARCSPSGCAAGATRAGPSSRAWSWPATWPTWATPAPW